MLMKYRVILGCVTVSGPPDLICLWNNGITDPDEPSTLPNRTTKVSLNSADAETLRRDLFGIGAAKAKAIVAYRETNGPFTAIDELLEVKGIGKALLEKNRDRLEVN